MARVLALVVVLAAWSEARADLPPFNQDRCTGKACKVASLTSSGAVTAQAGVCVAGATRSTQMTQGAAKVSINEFNNATCSGAPFEVGYFDNAGAFVTNYGLYSSGTVTGTTSITSTGTVVATTSLRSVGVAPASLPACVAGLAGAIETETLTGRALQCDGVSWRQLGAGQDWTDDGTVFAWGKVGYDTSYCPVWRLEPSVGGGGPVCTGFASKAAGGGRIYVARWTDGGIGATAGLDLTNGGGVGGGVSWPERPKFKARIRTGASVAQQALYVGLGDVVIATDSPTTQNVVFWRFSTAVPDTVWTLVACASGACVTAVSTVTVTAATDYRLSIDCRSGTACVGTVNGAPAVAIVTGNVAAGGAADGFVQVKELGDAGVSVGFERGQIESGGVP